MKKLLFLFLLTASTATVFNASAQKAPEDKSKRPSPPDSVLVTTKSGATIKINYSSPSVKGRAIGGNEIATYGKVWRTGANEATVFEVSKDVMVEGKLLKAGKYGFFAIPNEKKWVLIFNKTWNQWGAFKYAEAGDVLRVTVNADKAPAFTERLKYFADKAGKIGFMWGDTEIDFKVK